MQKAVQSIRQSLSGIYPNQEIQSIIFLIFEHFGISRTQLLTNSEIDLSSEIRLQISTFLEELKTNKPIQYVLGETEFYGLKFKVNGSVLIPRPETEELVEWIISENKNSVKALNIIDIGTGSGCIPISLSKNLANAKIFAMDISSEALTTAKQNAILNQVDIEFIQGDILQPKKEFPKFDIIVSNPPYIRQSESSLMQKNVLDFEPHLALFVPDSEALIFYEAIVTFAKSHLVSNGKIYFEINENFGTSIIHLLKNEGFESIQLKKDLSGKDRMVRCTKPF